MVQHYITLKILFKTFGFKIKYLIIPIYRLFYAIIVNIGSGIDFVFYPKYKRIKIKKPVFLIGHPRSGTTFLHKFMLKNRELRGMYLWEMFFSSIFLRKIIKPFLANLNKKFPDIYDENIHKTGLLEPETDDVAFFMRKFQGMFHWLYFSAWNKYENYSELKQDLINSSSQMNMIKYIHSLYRKNLIKCNSEIRMFSKSFSFILNITEVYNSFPDAKIIILMRDPKEVIPSSISLATSVQKRLNNFDKLPEKVKQNYYRNLYYASLCFYELFDEQMILNKSIKENVLVINYKELKNDFSNTIHKIFNYAEINITEDLLKSIKDQAKKQTTFKPKHKYSLQEFGFTEEEIDKDFSFIYSKYMF